MTAHPPSRLFLYAACGRARKEPTPHRLLCLRVPAPKPKTTRGWQPVVLYSIIHVIANIEIVDAARFGTLLAFGTRLQSEIVVNIRMWTIGEARPGARPTPQKRGPPPLRTG